MYQATFRVGHGSPYAEFTRHEQIKAQVWCNGHCDFIRITSPDKLDSFTQIRDCVGILNEARMNGEALLITDDCMLDHAENKIEPYLERYGCLLLPPFNYDHGQIQIRVLAVEERNLTQLYRNLNEDYTLAVESKREVDLKVPDTPALAYDSILLDLSNRQREAIRSAYEHGYYEIPRDTTTEELAALLEIERRTFEEHLRRAELKIVRALMTSC